MGSVQENARMAYPEEKAERDAVDLLGLESIEEMEKKAKAGEDDTDGDGTGGYDTKWRLFLKHAIRKQKDFAILSLYLVSAANLAWALSQAASAFYHMDASESLHNHPLYAILCSLFPLLVWAAATNTDSYNFHGVKKLTFMYCLANWGLLTWICYQRCVILLSCMALYALPTNGMIAQRTVVFAAYAFTAAASLLPLAGIVAKVRKQMRNPMAERALVQFRLKKYIGRRDKERRFRYDLNIIKNLKTGKRYRIKEKDRRLHFEGVGATGGGKTATMLTTSYERDLRQKVFNVDYQKKEVVKWLEEGKVRLARNFADKDFNIDYIVPAEGRDDAGEIQKDIEKLKFKAKSAGMTVMCPNAAFCEQLYQLAKAKGFRVNRIDPSFEPDSDSLRQDWIGFNPLYVPVIEGESFSRYLFRVFTASKQYCDVNQAIFEMGGKGDPYFSGLNRNLSVTGSVAVIMGKPLLYPGEYATISDVQDVINNFSHIRPYRDAIVKAYGKKNELGQPIMEAGKADAGPALNPIISKIDSCFLGALSERMNEQAVGLRNIIDESVMNPKIRELLCAEHTIDLDRALAQGEITLVNFEISLGSDSTGYGMFFLMSFINSVLRRPGTEDTRLPHFFAVDEAPVLFHPRIETCTTLFRQYNTAIMLLLQSLSQFEKNDMTRYLKNVLASNCAHQVIFGRASLEEMKYYQDLAGIKQEIAESEQIRETALTDENTSMIFSHSSKIEEKFGITGEDIRYREFLECTVFSTQDSTPLPPFLGKTDFLPKGYNPKMKRYKVDWSKYYREVPLAEEELEARLQCKVVAKTEIGEGNPKRAEGEERKKPEEGKSPLLPAEAKALSKTEVTEEERPLFIGSAEGSMDDRRAVASGKDGEKKRTEDVDEEGVPIDVFIKDRKD